MKPTESDSLRCAAFNPIRGETPGLFRLVSSADPVYLPPTTLVMQETLLVLPLLRRIGVSLHL